MTWSWIKTTFLSGVLPINVQFKALYLKSFRDLGVGGSQRFAGENAAKKYVGEKKIQFKFQSSFAAIAI